jgi:hypothetical protein
VDDLSRLTHRLCRELAQAERSAMLHPRREALRLGATPPGIAMLANAEHAEAMWPRLQALFDRRQIGGIVVGRVVGRAFSELRQFVLDRVLDAERSYRGTLLGLYHGIDVVRLLGSAAARSQDEHLLQFCNEWLAERAFLVERAERALLWFAECPRRALRSPLRDVAPLSRLGSAARAT